MELNREPQRIILNRLRDVYPGTMTLAGSVRGYADHFPNCVYLLEHGLIAGVVSPDKSNPCIAAARITKSGLDFLADDGGLSAILSVQTVRIHEDTLRQLLEAGLESCHAPEEKKSALREAIKNAPASAVLETIRATVGLALREAPDALRTLQNIFLPGV